MQKSSGNVFLGHVEELVFHIFPRLLSITGVPPKYLSEFLWIMLQYSIQTLAESKMELFVTKNR